MGERQYQAIENFVPATPGAFVTAQGAPSIAVDYNGAVQALIDSLGGVLASIRGDETKDAPARLDCYPLGVGADGTEVQLYVYGIKGRNGGEGDLNSSDGKWRIEQIGVALGVLGPNFENNDGVTNQVRICKSCTWTTSVRLRASLFGVDVRAWPGDDGAESPTALVADTAGIAIPDSGPFPHIAVVPRRPSSGSPATSAGVQVARWR